MVPGVQSPSCGSKQRPLVPKAGATGAAEAGVGGRGLTWGHGLHVSGELAAHVVVVGADVMETPVSQLVCTMELGTEQKRIYPETPGAGGLCRCCHPQSCSAGTA